MCAEVAGDRFLRHPDRPSIGDEHDRRTTGSLLSGTAVETLAQPEKHQSEERRDREQDQVGPEEGTPAHRRKETPPRPMRKQDGRRYPAAVMGRRRLELLTSTMSTWRSNQLS